MIGVLRLICSFQKGQHRKDWNIEEAKGNDI